MRQPKSTTSIERFFKDKNGRWAIVQVPNLLLTSWLILLLANLLLHDRHVQLLQSAILFAWAYLEMAQGESNFRKTLGAIILAGVTAGFFLG